jgi:SAM-dependent methyltransferase
MKQEWPLRLYSKSVLKQRKFKEIARLLGPTDGLRCLDVGGDNGVVSLLLRRRGGSWASGDLDERSVAAIRELVGTDVYQLDGGTTPFPDDHFDRVVIVDYLEHIPRDADFVAEMLRVLRPGGELIVNVPHRRPSLLRRFRHAIGQTDAKHGHLRPGYSESELRHLLGDQFLILQHRSYSKFFSEFIDTVITFAVSLLKRGKNEKSAKGVFVTGQDLGANQGMFKAYSLVYPLVWLISKLDNLLFFRSGYMMIARARALKSTSGLKPSNNNSEDAGQVLAGPSERRGA